VSRFISTLASTTRFGRVRAPLCAAFITFVLLAAFTASADTIATNLYSSSTSIGTGLPDTGGSVVRVFGAMLLVIALFLGGVWLYRNWQRLSVKKSGGAKLSLIEVKSLGQRQALYVVGYEQQRMLLASTPSGVTLVSHLPAAEEPVAEPAAPKLSFAEAFQHVLNRGRQ